jgi:hypothetical protein
MADAKKEEGTDMQANLWLLLAYSIVGILRRS